ncbi:MAG: efflux RND transporter periplasmic adaptor subunit [Acidobacteriota bacterium]
MAYRLMLVVLAALTAAACTEEPPPAPEVLRPVRTIVAEMSISSVPVTYAGVARASTVSALSFRVAGTVEAVQCKLGDRVGRGQVLARIDPTDYELQVDEAEASLAQARASLRRADADYERVRALYENDNASKADLDAARASAESARAQEEAGLKRLEQAQQQVGYTVLQAPAAGAIADVAVEVNENVGAGQAVITLEAAGRLEVEVAVAENEIGLLAEGQDVLVRFDALAGETFNARISEVGVAAAGGVTFPVIITLEGDRGKVRSGMAAEVTFAAGAETPRIWLPPVAVGEDRDGRHVFLLEAGADGEGVVRRHEVTVGQVAPGGIEIVGGLAGGELVVTAGVRRLADGMKVSVLPEQAATGDAG